MKEAPSKPVFQATMAEYQSATAHAFCAKDNTAVFVSTMESANKAARHAMHPQVVHNHKQGEPCNPKCLMVEPEWDDPGRKGLPHLQKPAEPLPPLDNPTMIDTDLLESAVADLDARLGVQTLVDQVDYLDARGETNEPEIPFRHNETEGYGDDGHLA